MQPNRRDWEGCVQGVAAGLLLPLVSFVAGAAVDTPGRDNPWELVMACVFGAAYLALAGVWLIHPGRNALFVLAGAVAPLVFLGIVGGVLERAGVAAVVLGVVTPACLLGGWLGATLKGRLAARPAPAAPRLWRAAFWLSATATALVAAAVALLLYLSPRAGPTANPNTGFFVVVALVEAGILLCFRPACSRGDEARSPTARGLLAMASFGSFFFGFALIGIGLVVARAPVLLPAASAAWLASAANLAAMVTATAAVIGEDRAAAAATPGIHL
ncbi:MAG TPA: hypothetical protein VHD61_06070 [Lacunisphaera sp.]|nr:hypothetical protein [Lacunisphaera sp.]